MTGNILDRLCSYCDDPYHHLHLCKIEFAGLSGLPLINVFQAFTAYTTNKNLGSPGKVYDLLTEAAKSHPVSGNADGSYLTMRSQEGAIFFVINLVGNFGYGPFPCRQITTNPS